MVSAVLSTRYCGETIDFEFKNGISSLNGQRATFTTNDRFVQDAIERDPRFGSMFVLSQVIKDEEEVAKEAAALEAPVETQSDQPKKSRKKKDDGTTQVPEVVTINDAYDYFAAKGIVIDDDEQLEQTMRELNVSFPNLEK